MSNKLWRPPGVPQGPTPEQIAAHHANTWAEFFKACLSAGLDVADAALRADEAHKMFMGKANAFFVSQRVEKEQANG